MRRARSLSLAWVLYLLALALIAFWPTPVDNGVAGPLQLLITMINERSGFPWLSYGLIEFVANIALFVPAGILIRLSSRKGNVFLLIAVMCSVTLSIELFQKLLLEQRFASPLDLLANASGVLVGLLVVKRRRSFTANPQKKLFPTVTFPL